MAKTKYDDTTLLLDAGGLFASLRPWQQQILDMQGSYSDRAAALGVPVGTVRSRLNRARKDLQRLIEHRNRQGDGSAKESV